MDQLENILAGEWVYALGWTVLHSLWQATVIAMIVGVVLLRMQKRAAWQRYWIANIGWLSILICALITFYSYYQPQDPATATMTTRLLNEGEAASFSSPSLLNAFLASISDYFNRHLPLIVSLWALGMSVFLLRFLSGLIFVQHLRTHKVQALPPYWENRLLELRRKLALRKPVQLLESALVKVPLVVGWLKPLILMPVGALATLSPQQVEAILAHELAHIKRHDYLLNMIRSLVEVLFYFNPAVWWLSAQIRTERENCCDDMALAVCGNSLLYVKALVALQELSQRPAVGLAMSFAGSKPELLQRVKRILNQPTDKSELMEKFVITCLLLLCLSFTLLSAGLPEEKTVELVEEIRIYPDEVPAEPVIKLTELKATDLVSEEQEVEIQLIRQDTLPSGNAHLQMTKDGKSYNVRIRDNKIQQLKIDGQTIPEKELVNYYDLVQELLDDVPEPPAPPAAPRPVVGPAPVAAPTPPSPPTPRPHHGITPPSAPTPPAAPGAPEAVPTPPSPPAAPRIKLEKPVKEEQDGEGYAYSYTITTDEEVELPRTARFVVSGTNGVTPSVWVRQAPGEELMLVELEDDNSLHPATGSTISVQVDQETPVVARSRAVWRTNDASDVVVVRSNDEHFNYQVRADKEWRQQMETNMLADRLLDANGSYHVELAGDQLLINGVAQSPEVYKKYHRILEDSLGKSLDNKSYYFFNRNTSRVE